MSTYVIITWPDIQFYMSEPDFKDNACLINSEPFLSNYGSSAYFVDKNWAYKVEKEYVEFNKAENEIALQNS